MCTMYTCTVGMVHVYYVHANSYALFMICTVVFATNCKCNVFDLVSLRTCSVKLCIYIGIITFSIKHCKCNMRSIFEIIRIAIRFQKLESYAYYYSTSL